MLNHALQGIDVDLPDPKPILPFLGLYTLVMLSPQDLYGSEIPAHHPPALFVLEGAQFVSAPADTSPEAAVVARIFDVSAISDELPKTYYTIPLSPEHAGFSQQRYWRVPAKPEVILMMLMERIIHVTESNCEEINQARIIYCFLHLHKGGIHEIRAPIGKKRLSETDNDQPQHNLPRPPMKKGRYGLRVRSPAQKATIPRPGPPPRKARRLKI